MTHPILPRRLWHETEKGRVVIEQTALIGRREPVIILGEAGMGPSFSAGSQNSQATPIVRRGSLRTQSPILVGCF
jgi:hypothetical protein